MQGPEDIRFAVDHMLVKLGKYLRILGYDAAWNTTIRTHDLIHFANREHRVLLTRNSHLPDEYPPPQEWLLLKTGDPAEQFHRVVEHFQLDARTHLFSQCIRCNARLEDLADKTLVEGKVHPNVFRQFNRFFRCPACGTIFWHGSHVRNTCRKLELEMPGQAGSLSHEL